MIEKIWSGQSPLWILLLPLSGLYGLVSNLIRLSYRLGLRKSWRAPVPVVVVGNLTAGGNGKTPVVVWLVEQLQQRGIRVGVVSRGYGGKAGHYPLVLDAHTSSDQAGDEPVLIFQRTGAAVAVSPVRCEAVQALLAGNQPQIIITDDGLQHYALARDYEIVVVDGIRRFGNGWWLPAGPMRERESRLRDVDAVITNGGTPQTGEIAMHLAPSQAVNLLTGEKRDASTLTEVVAMAGIGHQALTEPDVAALARPEQTLLMTEKDAVKCRAFAHANWWYLPVDAQIASPAADKLLTDILSLLR